MAAITDLINQVEDKVLRERLLTEATRLTKQKKFGLVFEEHIPECTPLYGVPIKRGSTVAKKAGAINDIYRVISISGNSADCIRSADGTGESILLSNLVSVAQFGEPIYPTLLPMASVQNGDAGDIWHTLIEADNYHALQLLEYLYPRQVDCIYIDPPYNTGARDWKYNNNYVDSTDAYRHSKWLSMMEKRLKLAKKLLNPEDSVLIVTIDEKEYLHLGCLLEELFPEATIQMIDSVINRKGVSHKGMGPSNNKKTLFSRVSEYIFFVMLGNFTICKSKCNMLDTQTTDNTNDVTENVSWLSMLRRGAASMRADKPKHFYPIFVNPENATIVSVGDPLPLEASRESVTVPSGLVAVWPMRTNGSEGRWQLKKETFEKSLTHGTAKLGTYNKKSDRWAINYLNEGTLDEIKKGTIIVDGKDDKGALVLKRVHNKLLEPKSVWNQTSHNASEYGTSLLNSIIGESRFSYPKSLYAIRDTLRMCTWNKPKALIVDFFAGSGTTLHAVNLLNAEDSGHRRCILVTNNEVSADEAKSLSAQGYQPGDPEWEKLGIAQYVTWPRTVCSIEGHDVYGNPLKGTYIGSELPLSDGFKSNCEYFKLGFLDKNEVALGTQFKKILPLLWLKAGAVGKRPEIADGETPSMLVLPQNKMAVLNDECAFMKFEEKLEAYPEIDTVFIITDSERAYREMISGLKVRNTYQLYRDYLDNFRINARR